MCEMNFEDKRHGAMDQLPRHVKRDFYCEECNRSYSIRYMDRHHRTYKHQRNHTRKCTPDSPI